MPETTVVFGRIAPRRQLPLSNRSLQEGIQAAIDPNARVTRYGRTWLFSKPDVHRGYIAGKLGFIRAEQTIETHYDRSKQDFVEQSGPSEEVRYSHFVITRPSLQIVFEIRPATINIQSFVGAFQGLVNQSRRVNVTLEVSRIGQPFPEWVKSTQRVVRFHASIRPANPHYSDRTDRLEKLLTESNADKIGIDATTGPSKSNGLRLENSLLGEIVDYEEEGYAEFDVLAESNGRIVRFDSREAIRKEKLRVPRGSPTDEIWRSMLALLRR